MQVESQSKKRGVYLPLRHKPVCWLYTGDLAQSVERPPHNREVVGSNPGRAIPKDVKTRELLLPCLGGIKGIEQRRYGAAQWLPGSRSIGQKEFLFTGLT